MTVEEIMTNDPVLVERRTTLRSAAQLMRDFDTGILPVINEQGLVGVVTDRDVVVRAIAEGVGPLTGYVEDSMSLGVVTCAPGEAVEDVASRMADHGCRRVVVIDGDNLPVGVMSLSDLAVRDETAGLAQRVFEQVLRSRNGG